ncbi:hypothetical protein FOPG_12626 [Fusarium oxysporum f. sp. conglutinans race 2 54008]|uniref:Uncharacterized protein n=1 Tax=Fusarium oxysporum f. sp. conglutinans race 2 54008 TaxID=1089457 RepID=X0IEN4_FUSOX|nr:hypothetical protein FOPG_12626 [Fusarium oxysporum f. sp. conglutinans race 2 54008]
MSEDTVKERSQNPAKRSMMTSDHRTIDRIEGTCRLATRASINAHYDKKAKSDKTFFSVAHHALLESMSIVGGENAQAAKGKQSDPTKRPQTRDRRFKYFRVNPCSRKCQRAGFLVQPDRQPPS